MAQRRRRLDIFFILYLTAIVGFVVVSKEREHRDDLMRMHNERIIRTFFPPVPVVLDRDTVRWYVSADSSGIVTGQVPTFTDKVYIGDIRENDDVSLSLHSVIHEGQLSSGGIVQIGTRTGFGNLYDHTVYFPVSAAFLRTGTYDINFTARSRRVYETTPGNFVYHATVFDTTLVPRDMLQSLEQGGVTLTVQVIDTSIAEPKTLEGLVLEVERSSITSAIGFEEVNIVRGNLGWSEPEVLVVRGKGRLEKMSEAKRRLEYRWTGKVTSVPDTVVIESRLARDAGGKDIARVMFTVEGTQPYLRYPLPSALYAGEELELNISVAGLEEEDLYSWALFEEAGDGDLLLKSEGKGPYVQYRIPNSYGGKLLVLEARYRDRPYRHLSARTHEAGTSRFSLPVLEPPTQITIDLPERASVMGSFRFAASRFIDPRFRGEQPIDRLGDVRVEIRDEQNNLIRTDVSMIRKGEFTFIIQDKDLISASGERVIVHVQAEEASVRAIMRLYR